MNKHIRRCCLFSHLLFKWLSSCLSCKCWALIVFNKSSIRFIKNRIHDFISIRFTKLEEQRDSRSDPLKYYGNEKQVL